MHLAHIQCRKRIKATFLAKSHGHNHTTSFVSWIYHARSCNISYTLTLSDPGYKLHLKQLRSLCCSTRQVYRENLFAKTKEINVQNSMQKTSRSTLVRGVHWRWIRKPSLLQFSFNLVQKNAILKRHERSQRVLLITINSVLTTSFHLI